MKGRIHCRAHGFAARIIMLAVLAWPLTTLAQTRIEAPDNDYKVSDDVKLGRQAAAEVERQLPLLPEDGVVDNYIESVGRRLTSAIPAEFRHPEFSYQFDVVNARDLNAFALPGGYMYINRGLIEAARNEGELAGVMAHEISHVALRHGTAQASKAQSWQYQLPAIGGTILGAIIGGTLGSVVAQGTQFGLSVHFLRYSRDYERQADILGAQIMARAGYDPRDLANMFRTIESQGGSGGPEWLSSHPNPENRYENIQREAQLLGVSPSEATQNTAQFSRIQAVLRDMSPAPSMQEIGRRGNSSNSDSSRDSGDVSLGQRVQLPSNNYRTYSSGDFQVRVPVNWREFQGNNAVTFAPAGAYGNYRGQSVFTHGAIVGTVRTGSTNLRQATDQYINALLQINPYLTAQSGYRSERIDGRNALSMTLSGVSGVTGRTEVVNVYTTMLRGGDLFYVITVSPRDQYGSYQRAFRDIVRSINLGA